MKNNPLPFFSCTGKFGIKPSFLLNVPYMIIPYASCARFISERPPETQPRIQVCPLQNIIAKTKASNTGLKTPDQEIKIKKHKDEDFIQTVVLCFPHFVYDHVIINDLLIFLGIIFSDQ